MGGRVVGNGDPRHELDIEEQNYQSIQTKNGLQIATPINIINSLTCMFLTFFGSHI